MQEFGLRLLGDFNASEGDIWKIVNITTNFGSQTPLDTLVLKVDSVSNMSIENDVFKLFYTSMLNQSQTNFEFGGRIIEKIGASIFYPSFQFCDPVPGELRCYYDGENYIKFSEIECDLTILNIDKQDLKKVAVYPNPIQSNELLTIEFSGNYSIINNLGQMVQNGKVENHQINLDDVPKGSYFLVLENGNQLHKLKIVKL